MNPDILSPIIHPEQLRSSREIDNLRGFERHERVYTHDDRWQYLLQVEQVQIVFHQPILAGAPTLPVFSRGCVDTARSKFRSNSAKGRKNLREDCACAARQSSRSSANVRPREDKYRARSGESLRPRIRSREWQPRDSSRARETSPRRRNDRRREETSSTRPDCLAISHKSPRLERGRHEGHSTRDLPDFPT